MDGDTQNHYCRGNADVRQPGAAATGTGSRRIDCPAMRGREAAVKVHSRNVKLDPAVDLSITARGTPVIPAELANLLNEAALLAARAWGKI